MSFDYTISANASKAIAEVEKAIAANEQLEEQAKKTGQAITEGFRANAVKDSQGRFVASSVAAQQAANAAAGLADKWLREEQMLNRIRAPLREYEDGLRALDGLLERNSISTKEYADEVTKLNAKIGERPTPKPTAAAEEGGGLKVEGNIGQAVSGQFGEVGSLFQGVAAGGAIEAAALVGVTVEAMHLTDEYIQLTNKALKFVDATHDTNTVLNDQYELSLKLHGGLDQTLEIYDAVRDGTDELNIGYDKQIRLTQSIGEAVQLSGRSLSDAGGLMQRLSYAFASGTLSGRELKGMMREFPDIADVWTKSLGHTRKELIAMANDGQLGARDLMDAFIKAGPELDEKFGKRAETLSQQWQHFKDNMTLVIGKVLEASGIFSTIGFILEKVGELIGAVVSTAAKILEFSGLLKILGVGFKVLGGIIDGVTAVVKGIGDTFSWLGDRMSDVGGLIKAGWDAITDGGERASATELLAIARGRAMIGMLNDQQGAFKWMHSSQDTAQAFYDTLVHFPNTVRDISTAFEDMGRKFGLATDKWDAPPTKFARATKLAMDQSAKIGDLKADLAALAGSWDKSTFALDAYHKKLVELVTVINGGTMPAWMAEDQLMKKAYADLTSINIAMESGQMATYRYHEQWKALMTTLNGGELPATIKILDGLHEPQRVWNNDMAATIQLFDAGKISAEDYAYEVLQLNKANPIIQRATELIDEQRKAYDRVAAAAKLAREMALAGVTADNPMPLNHEERVDNSSQMMADLSIAKASDAAQTEKQIELEKRYQAVVDESSNDVDKFMEARLRLEQVKNDGMVTDAFYEEHLKKIHDQYDDMRTPLAKFADDVELAKEKFDGGIYSIDEYTKKLKELKIAISGKDFAEGLVDGFKKIKEEIGDTGTIISKTMVQAFDQVNSSLEDMVLKGRMDFDALGSAFEKMLVDMTLKLLESQILSFLAPGGVGGGGSASAGAVAGILDAAIPKHAEGTQYIVGGPSGVDQSLQAFWGSRGERVTVETEAQQTRRDMASAPTYAPSGGPAQIINQWGDDELLAALPSRAGNRAVLNVLRRQPGAARSLLRQGRR